MNVLKDCLVTVTWWKVKENHVLGPRVFKHSIFTNPFLNELPDFLLRLLPLNEISVIFLYGLLCGFVTQFSGSGYGYDVTCIRAVYLDGKVLYWWLQ